ncbi:MAG: PilZ domain-containing protein [Myxococcales bacterium]|nr:PilZ domain-containing protein [Myxococcales bacterium]
MDLDDSAPRILLLHDKELSDIRNLLEGLGFAFVERMGGPIDVDYRTRWDLIVSSQKRLSFFTSEEIEQDTRRIAIIDNDSRTLRAMLQRVGVDYIVARPVHAAAIRLLVLHCIYKGPERRRQTRVTVGAKIQLRSGLFKRDALLADISLHGCRLICDKPIKAGIKLKLYFPAEMGGGKGFMIPGQAIRTAKAGDGIKGHVVAGSFRGLSPAQGKLLRKLFESYKNGPARLQPADSGAGLKPPAVESKQPTERRTAPRKEFEKHVVTVDDEATRVLLCRDISVGGMRVEPNDSLVPGDDLLVAVHIGARSEPMVVNARVTRDDGEEGLVLSFYDISRECENYLNKMVGRLPDLANSDDADGSTKQNVIVSEIVERRAS